MKMQRVAATLLAMAMLGVLPPLAKAQSSSGAGVNPRLRPSLRRLAIRSREQTYIKPTHEPAI